MCLLPSKHRAAVQQSHDVQTPMAGWMTAFAAHPKLGDRAGQAPQTSSDFARSSAAEQSKIAEASPSVTAELAELNDQYEAKFGHVFLLYADGRSASEVRTALVDRYA